jgi:hypothetical protein
MEWFFLQLWGGLMFTTVVIDLVTRSWSPTGTDNDWPGNTQRSLLDYAIALLVAYICIKYLGGSRYVCS